MNDDGQAPRLGRRLLVLRVAGVGAAAGTLSGCVVAPQPVYAPRPARTGLTDADPGDGPGMGRGGYRGYRRGTGLTDADPNDGPGQGRGRGRRQVSDSDPRDAPGRGRGW
jgi:hypothetical protein